MLFTRLGLVSFEHVDNGVLGGFERGHERNRRSDSGKEKQVVSRQRNLIILDIIESTFANR
ncbi:hypothetical protein H9L39_15382 [Fusarium oxysporum f. sp. albedinis]|nr:hypothetical protein H9L39_15382 [Fusarium oxysporum f. sp. albedinis]